MNVTKKLQTHRHTEQTRGFQWEEGKAEGQERWGSKRYKPLGVTQATGVHYRGLPGGPVLNPLRFHCRGYGSDPGWGTEVLRAAAQP